MMLASRLDGSLFSTALPSAVKPVQSSRARSTEKRAGLFLLVSVWARSPFRRVQLSTCTRSLTRCYVSQMVSNWMMSKPLWMKLPRLGWVATFSHLLRRLGITRQVTIPVRFIRVGAWRSGKRRDNPRQGRCCARRHRP